MTVLPFPKRATPDRADTRKAEVVTRLRDWMARRAPPRPNLYVPPSPAAPDDLLRVMAQGWGVGVRDEDLARAVANAMAEIAQELLAHRAAQDLREAREQDDGA